MHQDSIKLWFRDILNWLDMIRSATLTPCIRGKERVPQRSLQHGGNRSRKRNVFRSRVQSGRSYIKYFDLDKSMCGKRIHICFEGVEEAMYLWLNGQFVGYAEDSFTPSEFDLTPYIKETGNVLAVQVHKMSTAAFLEDQDFFRFLESLEMLL